MFEEVWFSWGAENDEIEVPKKIAETGGNRMTNNSFLQDF
jgi:hypothetical protein